MEKKKIMFDETSPTRLKSDIIVRIHDKFEKFIDVTSNDLFQFVDEHWKILATTSKKDYVSTIQNTCSINQECLGGYILRPEIKVVLDKSKIVANKKFKDIEFKVVFEDFNQITQIVAIDLTLPKGTEFYFTYMKCSKLFSPSSAKIKITDCPIKSLKNTTIPCFDIWDFIINFKLEQK